MTMFEILPNWHPIFVHFTIALFTVSIALFGLSRLFARTEFGTNSATVALWSLRIGLVLSLLTLVSGWDAYNSVNHDDASHAAMEDHRLWALITMAAFVGVFVWTLLNPADKDSPGAPFLLVGAAAFLLLLTTAYKGGHLVYKYGLGVASLPQVEAAGHAHSDGGHSHDTIEASVEPSTGDSMPEPEAPLEKTSTDAPPLEKIDVAPIETLEDEPVEMDADHAHDDGHDHEH